MAYAPRSPGQLRGDRGRSWRQPGDRLGRVRGADRSQWRREVLDAESHCGLRAGRGGSVHFEGRDITNASGQCGCAFGHHDVPGGTAGIPADERHPEPAHGGLRTQGQGAGRRSRADDGIVPDPAGTSDAGSGQALRRRAGDAGHCASADGATAHLPLRRAISGPGSQDRRQWFSRRWHGSRPWAWTILLVEQNSMMALTWRIEPTSLRRQGRARGTGKDLKSHPDVKRAYLGH